MKKSVSARITCRISGRITLQKMLTIFVFLVADIKSNSKFNFKAYFNIMKCSRFLTKLTIVEGNNKAMAKSVVEGVRFS